MQKEETSLVNAGIMKVRSGWVSWWSLYHVSQDREYKTSFWNKFIANMLQGHSEIIYKTKSKNYYRMLKVNY